MISAQQRSDRELLEDLQRGDAAACEALFERHAGLVRSACRRQVHGQAVDDAAQAVFLVLLRRPEEAAKAPAVEAWLLRTVWFVCLQIRRNYAVRRRLESEAQVRHLPAQVFEDPDGLLPVIDEAMQRLPDRQRMALSLQYFAGQSQAEIAVRLGIRANAVKQLVHRGLTGLRTYLRRKGFAVPTATLLALFASQRAEAAEGEAASGMLAGRDGALELPAQLARRMVRAENLAEAVVRSQRTAKLVLPASVAAGFVALIAMGLFVAHWLSSAPLIAGEPEVPETPVSTEGVDSNHLAAPESDVQSVLPAERQTPPESGTAPITAEALICLRAVGKAVLLDCCGTESYRVAHVPGAVDVEASQRKLAPYLPTQANDLIVLYDRGTGCNQAAGFSAALQQAGYRQVRVLIGGLSAWIAAGGPSVSGFK